MSLNNSQKKKVSEVIKNSLFLAEKFWDECGKKLESEESETGICEAALEGLSESRGRLPSPFPGEKFIRIDEAKNGSMIALVADMRNSTRHAKTEIQIMSPLQRIFLEVSALLPAMETVINFEKGQVTEYLGDGVLGFFEFKKPEDILNAYRAAENIIIDMREILNQMLFEKYKLPKEINIGVGLANSQTIIYAAGLLDKKHPKAFGSCVFDATKIACEHNKIAVSESLKAQWPKSKNGKLIFKRPKRFNIDTNYFVISKSSM